MPSRSLLRYSLCVVVASALPAYAEKIYWHHWEAGVSKIKRANLDGSEPQDLIDLASAGVGDIALDKPRERIYWTEDQGIRRARLNGTLIETIMQTATAAALAIDEVNQWLYWSDGEDFAHQIRRSSLDGHNAQLIVSTGSSPVEGIGIDSNSGKMYYILAGGSIRRANLDGTADELLISKAGQDWTPDLVLDVVNRKMYWTDYHGDTIRRANLDGTSIETIPLATTHPYKLDVDPCQGMIYWIEAPGGPMLGPARRARTNGQDAEEIITTGVNYLAVFSMFTSALNPPKCIPAISSSGVAILIVGIVLSAGAILSSRRSSKQPLSLMIFILGYFACRPSAAQSADLIACRLDYRAFTG